MTNEDYALLLDPERKRPGWWKALCPKCGLDAAYMSWWSHTYCQSNQEHLTKGPPVGYRYTGPDYHASDDACFRDWRPVLLAAGCRIECVLDRTDMPRTCVVLGLSILASDSTYRAATLAAIEKLHTTKPELLREAIARVEGGANG